MGWAKPGPSTWVGLSPARVNSASTVHMLREQWRHGKKGEEAGERRKGEGMTCGGVEAVRKLGGSGCNASSFSV